MTKNSKVKISYLVPVRNKSRTIKGTLYSILKQMPYEIIVVDGKSTDGTSEIIDELVKYHPTIKHIYDESKGPASAQNLGVFMAKGEYIIIVGGDEYINKIFGEKLVSTIINNNYPEIILHNYEYLVNENNIWSKIYKQDRLFSRARNIFLSSISHYKYYPDYRIFKTEFLKKINAYDEAFKGGYEDGDLSIKTTKIDKSIIINHNIKILKDERYINPIKEFKRGIFYSNGLIRIIRKHKIYLFILYLFPLSLIANIILLPLLYYFRRDIKVIIYVILLRSIRSIGHNIGILQLAYAKLNSYILLFNKKQ